MTYKIPLSVAYLSPGWPLSYFPNGIVAYIENLINGFDSNTQAYILANQTRGNVIDDHTVDLSAISLHRTLVESCLDKLASRTSLSCAKRYLAKGSLYRHAKKINEGLGLLAIKPDIIEVEESYGRALPLVERLSTPIVTRLHGPWFLLGGLVKDDPGNLKARVKAEELAILASQGVTSPSENVLSSVREYYGHALPEARVIPNPVKSTPKHLHWHVDPSAPPSILFVGRFDSIKGADIAINAFRIVAAKNKEVELFFVGPDRGINVSGKKYSLDDYLKDFIPELNIRGRVKNLGHCTSDEIAKLRQKANVTMVTSRYENFPMSLLEALSAGCPTVGVAVGGIKEIIKDDFNGLLAEPESADSVAENIVELLGSPKKSNEVSINAIIDCEKRFSPVVVAEQTVAYYKEILSR